MSLALLIAVPIVIAGGIWAWCLCRLASKPTPKPLDERFRDHQGDDQQP